MALLLNLGVAGIYAQQKPVNIRFSGSNVATTINLQNGTVTDEEILAGTGTLGPFTYRELHADTLSSPPQPPISCSGPTQIYFLTVTGGGVFRFQDGSLLTVTLKEGTGSGCVDLTAGLAHLVGIYQVTGGTGRFKGASGTLTRTSTIAPVLFDAAGNPALLTNKGKFEGTVFGVAEEEERNDERQ
ncbi:hypothetical protein JAO29_19890 [Edaphobacter sp. HDX4]|uniref:hypothetical protein n=1 Tax=Edaphobacter sp. HDX4 TaxID=2794064 RepID=UPI002FE51DDB